MTSKAQFKNAKIISLEFIKIKNFALQDTTKKINKRQSTNRKKRVVTHVYDKRPVFRIYKELLKLSKKRKNDPVIEWTEDLN